MPDGGRPTSAIELRPYQAEAIAEVRAHLKAGSRRVLVSAMTGAGKSVLALDLLSRLAAKGRYGLYVVDRTSLVEQQAATFAKAGIPVGVLRGDDDRWAPWEHVQVCSVQTLARRALPRVPDAVVIDECHVIYKSLYKRLEEWPNARLIGMTATPFTKGMGLLWDKTVDVATADKLTEWGFLSPIHFFEGRRPGQVGAKFNSSGEYDGDFASEGQIAIVGDVVSEVIRLAEQHFGDPRKVKMIGFACNVDHAHVLAREFTAAGVPFESATYRDGDNGDCSEIINRFRGSGRLEPDEGAPTGLVSVESLGRGFDVPEVRLGFGCRPYRKSLSSHVQQVGRVGRVAEGKPYGIWADFCGNVARLNRDLWDLYANGPGELSAAEKQDSKPRKDPSDEEKPERLCPECEAVLRGMTCDACGWVRAPRSEVIIEEGKLHALAREDALYKPRKGLRAECLKDPAGVYRAALWYALDTTRHEDKARKRAYAIWRGIYPDDKPGRGWYDQPQPREPEPQAMSLIEREVARFRSRK